MNESLLRGSLAGLGVATVLLGSLAHDPALTTTVETPTHARVNAFGRGAQDSVALAPADDRLMVIWRSARQHEGRAAVRGRILDADGLPQTAELEFDLGQPHGDGGSAVRSAPHTWASWQGYPEHGADRVVWLRRLDRADAFRVDAAPGEQLAPTLVEGTAGGVTVAWLQADGPTLHACARSFDAEGRARAPRVVLGAAQSLAAVRRADGRTAIVWAAPAPDHAGTIRVAHVDAAGRFCGDSVALISGAALAPSVAATADGGLALAWLQPRDASFAVHGALVDARGHRTALQIAVPAPGQHLNAATCAAGAAGQVAFAWNEHDLTSQRCRVQVRRLGSSGLGEPVTLAPHGALASDSRCRALWHGDALAVAWSGNTDGGAEIDAHVSLLRPQTPANVAKAERLRAGWAKQATPAAPDTEAPHTVTHGSAPAIPHDPPRFEPTQQPQPEGSTPLAVGPDFTFTAITNTGWSPPDPHLAVGPNHVVTTTNGGLAFFTKTGTRTFFQTISGATGFWGSLGATNFVFDPEVHWDPWANRFVAFACERTVSSGTGLSYFVIAYSDDADPNGTWHRYRIDVTAAGGGGDIDSPNLGIDQNAVYLTADFFTGGQKYLVFMADKTPLLSGQPLGTTRNLLISGSQSFGLPVLWGAGNAMYLIEHFEAAANTTVRLHAITNALTTPTRTTFTLTVPSYGRPVTATAGTSSITTFDARFWSCTFRDGYLWACHHHAVGALNAVRWYQVDVRNWPGSGTPALVQSGTVTAPNAHCTFNSIAVNSRGDALMTFARSSAAERISIARTYRLATDPLGTMRPMRIVANSPSTTTGSRWGDYSAVAPDPADDDVLWYTHENIPATAWATVIGRRELRDWLTADVATLSAASGGAVAFELEAPSASAGDNYLLLGSFSGTSPGTPLGPVTLPINFDGWSGAILATITSPLFTNFVGVLDANACATAGLNVPPVPPLNGLTMHYAFATWTTDWRFASNAVGITFTP